MKLEEIIAIADAAYADGFVGEYFDPKTQKAKELKLGDTLARFIVIELCETYDSKASEADQLNEAQRVLAMARDELESVIVAFGNKMIELRRDEMIRGRGGR